MPYADLNGVRYHYEVEGEGPPLLLLHGFTGSLENWSSHVQVFAANYQVIAVDLLGHGQTDAPDDPLRYAMEKSAADLAALLDHLGIASVNPLGYSMGGRLVLYFALFYPERVRSLILESASPGLETDAERAQRRTGDETLARRIEAQGIPAFVDFWESIPLFQSQHHLPDDIRLHLRDHRLRNSSSGLANSLRGMGTGVQPNLWPRLPELKMPVLLIVGESDEKFRRINHRMAAHVPDAHMKIVSGTGHTTHLEAPETFQQVVLQFLVSNSAN